MYYLIPIKILVVIQEYRKDIEIFYKKYNLLYHEYIEYIKDVETKYNLQTNFCENIFKRSLNTKFNYDDELIKKYAILMRDTQGINLDYISIQKYLDKSYVIITEDNLNYGKNNISYWTSYEKFLQDEGLEDV